MWSSSTSLLTVIVQLAFTWLIQTSVCSPIRKHIPRQHNSIIHARIGESINISCWFDPNSMSPTRFKQLTIDDFDYSESPNRRNQRDANINSRAGGSVERTFESFSSRFRDDNGGYYKSGLDSDVRESDPNYGDNWSPSQQVVKTPSKYELDWYFWDKEGKFKIISYGNLTASNFKYKTFVNREELGSLHRHHSAGSSAAALYSQTSSRSSSSAPNRFVYTYYLNALIESEQDEGVYQCINPDSPDYILRNVTVLIERNNAMKYRYQFSIVLSYCVVFIFNNLLVI